MGMTKAATLIAFKSCGQLCHLGDGLYGTKSRYAQPCNAADILAQVALGNENSIPLTEQARTVALFLTRREFLSNT